MNGHLQLAPRSFPDRIAALGFTTQLPVDWISHELPTEEPNFGDPTSFVPLALVTAPHAAIVFAFVARPAYDDGTVHDWAMFLLNHNQLQPRAIGREMVAGVPAVVGEATQESEVGPLVVRFAFFEDGGRLVNVTLTAPELFADSVRAAWFAMLQSFTLESPRGSRFASDGSVAAGAPSVTDASTSHAGAAAAAAAQAAAPGAANESTPFLTPDELIALALADDTASLDPELEFNANLRNRGVGFVPRVARVDAASKSVFVGAGAVEGFFRVPFGWHVIDDGRRTLVFDAEGCIQVNLNLRRHEGMSTEEYAEQLLVQYLEQQPELPTIRHTLAGIAVSAVRGVRIGEETLDQYFLVRDIGRAGGSDGLYLVVKVSATAEHCSRAMDLAGDITATFAVPGRDRPMACTIDHLRVDAHVLVLRDFTDLSGVVVRVGEAAVVRGLGLDLAEMEIWIELERGAVRERLRFALRATDGPRNGHMSSYFEVVEAVAAAPVGAKPAPAAPLAEPQRERAVGPQPVRRTHDARDVAQAPHDTDLGDRRVACECDPAFQRDLLSARGELTLAACLCCGTVTCSRTVGDDGRFTGDAWQKNITVALPEAVHAWMAGWPRVKVDHTTHVRWPMGADLVRYRTLHYPADLRCDDLGRLAEVEEQLAREQAGQSWGERLRATQRVTAPPPAGVPEQLRGYELLWHALQLTPQSDVEVLLHHAQLRSPGSDVAAELVRARPDVFDVVAAALRSDDATRRGAGFAIARDWRAPDPRIEGLLVELLEGLSLEPLPHSPMFIAGRGRGEMLLLLVAELRLATPNMLAVLRALMRTLARHDDFLTDCVRSVVKEMNTSIHSNP